MSESAITSDQNRAVHEQLVKLAEARHQESEEGLMQVAPYDPNSPYHDLNIDVHPNTRKLSSEALQHMAELLLHNFDRTRYTPGRLETFTGMRDLLRPQLAPIKPRLEAGNRLMVVTAHQTRFEPAVGAFLVQAALAETPQEHDDLRNRTSIIISQYLRAFNVNIGMLMGGEDKYENLVKIASEIGSIVLSFPNSFNMRKLSGIDQDFQRSSNTEPLQKIGKMPPGSICANAANGTMEKLQNGVYPISDVQKGTRRIIKDGWDVIFLASALDIDKPFSTASRLIPAGEVTDEVIHGGMTWIAQTLSDHDVPATYAKPDIQAARAIIEG